MSIKKKKTDPNGPVCAVKYKEPPSLQDEGEVCDPTAKRLYPALLFRHRDRLDPVLGTELA
ncbi:hypothetical protein J14TS5_39990 [Paenibacillus lautus]|nr:hypothetical protein J14TS5_39990 [Paenibacillus lautus]